MRKGNLFVISGPSGAGKGTLVACLLREVPDTWVSVSATTRSPRPHEKDGVDYVFLTEEEFATLVEQGGFLEWAEVHGYHYGTLRKRVEEHIASGQQVILEIDVQGADQVRCVMPDAHFIFIEPPSLEELERRLRGRATESEDVIIKRLETAKLELLRKKEYDIQLVNDEIPKAAQKLISFVNSCADR